MNRKCLVCGSEERHYAKGLCRNCYTRMNSHGFKTPDELLKYETKKKRNKAIRERRRHQITEEQIKIRSTNEFYNRPHSVVSKAVIDWYYGTTDRYLIFDFETERDRMTAYNTIYAMTKRRHPLQVRRFRRNNSIIVERIA